jgi:aminopeptidase N
MKKIIPLFVLLYFALTTIVTSQVQFQKGSDWCSYKKTHGTRVLESGWDSPNTPKHTFDVLKYTLNLDIRSCFISPYPKSYTAYEIIQFRIDTVLNQIQLNAVNTSLQINSVSLNGVSFTHSSNVLTITLDRTYNPNEVAQVRIDFQHLNVSDQAFYASNGGVFTDCPPEGARKWFPCFDKPYDKALFELTVKVPANAKLGSNGSLNDSTVAGDSLFYHWISRDPIATYLMVMTAKVNYNLNIIYWHKLSNPLDSIPMRFYYNNAENPASIMNIINDMTTYYSQKFGEYPFEKGGFTTAPTSGFMWGGMENQTLITFCQNCWNANLTSHEYAHMWFGDMITCGTWADVWLNEGFATYCEALWYEHTGGYSSYKSAINNDANYYISQNPHWPIWNPQWAVITPDINTLYNTAITYDKGACVLHMLRYTLGDTLFFACIKNYATDTTNFKNKGAVTDDFATSISTTAGQDLTWFINEWVKLVDHPIYQNVYQFTNSGSNWSVGFQANQIQTTTPFHKMPIVLKITFTSGPDTSIRVMNDTNNQAWWWTFTRQPSTFAFDPNNDIVLKQGGTSPGVIGIQNEQQIPFVFELHQNYPNPFNPVTRINYDIPKRSVVTIKIYNILGQLVAQPLNEVKVPGKYTLDFDASTLASGVYYYEIKAGAFSDTKKMVLVK